MKRMLKLAALSLALVVGGNVVAAAPAKKAEAAPAVKVEQPGIVRRMWNYATLENAGRVMIFPVNCVVSGFEAARSYVANRSAKPATTETVAKAAAAAQAAKPSQNQSASAQNAPAKQAAAKPAVVKGAPLRSLRNDLVKGFNGAVDRASGFALQVAPIAAGIGLYKAAPSALSSLTNAVSTNRILAGGLASAVGLYAAYRLKGQSAQAPVAAPQVVAPVKAEVVKNDRLSFKMKNGDVYTVTLDYTKAGVTLEQRNALGKVQLHKVNFEPGTENQLLNVGYEKGTLSFVKGTFTFIKAAQ